MVQSIDVSADELGQTLVNVSNVSGQKEETSQLNTNIFSFKLMTLMNLN